jgi:hypothetical protein
VIACWVSPGAASVTTARSFMRRELSRARLGREASRQNGLWLIMEIHNAPLGADSRCRID